MSELASFLTHQKTDAHNHLNLGMRYSSYAPWARFYIPNFPRVMNGLEEMHEVISTFTRPRCFTKDDVKDLIKLSIFDAVEDAVTVLEGSVDIGFMVHFDEDYDSFLGMISELVKANNDKIIFRPELGLGKTFDIENIKKWTPILLESGVFKSIDLYGPEVEDGIENFIDIYKTASRLGIKKKAHIGEFSSAESIKRFIETFELDEVQHGISAVHDESIMKYLADRKIRCNICPASNVQLSAVPSMAQHPIKTLVEHGVRVSIGTDDLLFFDRTVSEQCDDLFEAGVLTKEQIFAILDDFEQ